MADMTNLDSWADFKSRKDEYAGAVARHGRNSEEATRAAEAAKKEFRTLVEELDRKSGLGLT